MTSLTYVTFLSGVHWPTGSMYTKVYDSLNITIAIWALKYHKYHYALAWDTLLTDYFSLCLGISLYHWQRGTSNLPRPVISLVLSGNQADHIQVPDCFGDLSHLPRYFLVNVPDLTIGVYIMTPAWLDGRAARPIREGNRSSQEFQWGNAANHGPSWVSQHPTPRYVAWYWMETCFATSSSFIHRYPVKSCPTWFSSELNRKFHLESRLQTGPL